MHSRSCAIKRITPTVAKPIKHIAKSVHKQSMRFLQIKTAHFNCEKDLIDLAVSVYHYQVAKSINIKNKTDIQKDVCFIWRRRRDSLGSLLRSPTRTRTPKQSPGLFLRLRLCPVRVSLFINKK